MGYTNYAGVYLQQSNANYDWLSNPSTPVALSPGVDTVKIWQSYNLPNSANNLVVFGDNNYAAGNGAANVIVAAAAGVQIYGGFGDDVFVGSGGSGTVFLVAQNEGDKVIQNFVEGADKLRLIGGPLTSFTAVTQAMSQQGSDVVLNDGGTMILFRNSTIGEFQARDFQLPLNTATLGPATFTENFDSAATIGANWQTNFGYGGLSSYTLPNNAEQQLYTSAAFQGTTNAPLGLNPFSFSNGVMTISATHVTDAQAAQMWGYHYSSGMLESNFSQTYGYFEMKAELPQGKGLWPAFWLLGQDNKEIDVLEALGSDTQTIYNAVHSNAVPSLGDTAFNPHAGGMHTYGVLWTAQTLTYYVDSAPVWQTATPADMNSPLHIIVNLAVGGNWPGSPDSSTPFPANMKIDYIHAYALGNGAAPAPPPPAPPPPPVAPPPATGDQVLTSAGFGSTLAGGAGNDTLISVHGNETMTGAAGSDHFVFNAMPWNPTVITDFQLGVDRLDVSQMYVDGFNGVDPVGTHHVVFASDGHGGTSVSVDVDGVNPAHPWPGYVADLLGVSPVGLTADQVFGGAPPPPATGGGGSGAAGVALTSKTNFPGSVLTGGAGADTLTAGSGSDTMTGGGGADHFGFAKAPWAPTEITDFVHGQDVLDLRGLFAGVAYSGTNPVADHYLSFSSDGAGGTKVLFDPDGTGSGHPWPDYIIHLDHVAPGSLTAGDWLAH